MTQGPTWRAEWERARRFARRLEPADPCAPLPPPLPPGRVEAVPGRGEMFIRELPGPAGSPTVVLLHGWTVSADLNWFRVYEGVAPVARVLAVDHRGHGRGIRSEEPFSLEAAADDVAALLRHLQADPAVLVGYSMGGPIAMLCARRHPDQVAGLVLAATGLEWRQSRRERLAWRFMAVVEYLFRLGRPRGLVQRALREAVEQDPDVATWRPWITAELRRGDPEALAEAGRALGRYDGRPFAGDLQVPSAVVLTARDRMVRPRKQRALAAALPDCEVFPVEADHDAALVAADAFSTATVAAVESVARRRWGGQSRERTAGWGNQAPSDRLAR